MTQTNFTFKTYKQEIYLKGTAPISAISHKESLRNRMVEKGYLVTDLKEQEVIMVSCLLAKANIPLIDRVKKQKQIDEMPEPKLFLINKKV